MEKRELRELLSAVADGTVAVEEASQRLSQRSFEDLGYAKPDLDRSRRQGVSEVVYGAGKTAEQIVGIVGALRAAGDRHIMVTRLDTEKARDVAAGLSPENAAAFTYHELPRVGIVGNKPQADGIGYVVVAAAGSMYDVGVAGLHRLLSHTDELRGASAVVAIAGMEGALASVIGGLVPCPVIACPTSVGYGASLGGIAALLSMLNSCASGVSVVNIDNGFGAGYQAALIDHVGRWQA